jgi:putative phosphoribosyl transferase
MMSQLAFNGTPPRTFIDRHSAGLELARVAKRLRLPPRAIVLGLPRGGVPVAFEVAKALHAPLDVLVVRKIGMPANPEVAIGAIAPGGVIEREPGFDGLTRISPLHFEALAHSEKRELDRRERAYRGARGPLDLAARAVVLVDDGLATGATMIAAIRAARQAGAQRVIAAAPVASDEAAARVGAEADETLFLRIPAYLTSIGEWYDDFRQIEDDEVCALLERASGEHDDY